MKISVTQFTCDSCFVVGVPNQTWMEPEGWMNVRVQESGKNQQDFNLCGDCWNNGRPPRIDDIPEGIRRFFKWARPMKGEIGK